MKFLTNRIPKIPQKIRLFLLALVLAGGVVATAQAQTNPPPFTITSINILGLSSDSATITWRTPGVESDSKIFYGTNRDNLETEGTEVFNSNPVAGDAAHSLTLQPLQERTTYYFIIISQETAPPRAQIARTDTPRDFQTPASSGDTTRPTVINLNVSANNSSASVRFDTAKPARVILRYGTNPALAEGPVEDVNYLVSHELALPKAGDPSLVGNTNYLYQITATDNQGNVYNTSDSLTFRTSGSEFDRVFTTGGCGIDADTGNPVDIGECFQNGDFCDGGTPINDCTRCGAQCSASQTCQSGGSCTNDPPLTGNAFQCNKNECYNDQFFRNPAPAGCWRSWPRCSANVVLKVQRDRVCDQWMTCTVSQETTLSDGTKVDMCVGLGGCSSLGPGGTCNSPLGQGQCSGDPLQFCNIDADCNNAGGECVISTSPSVKYRPVTYVAPEKDQATTEKIKNLTGAIVAGLDWRDGNKIIQGQYPWFLAPQYGEAQNDFNQRGDFEFAARTLGERGTSTADKVDWSFQNGNALSVVFENDISAGLGATDPNVLNHVLSFTPGNSAQPDRGMGRFYGPAETPISGYPTLSYFVKFRARTLNGTNKLQPQFATECADVNINSCPRFVNLKPGPSPIVDLDKNWQDLSFGPIIGLSDLTFLNMFVNDDVETTTSPIQIDNVSVSSVLEIRPSEYVFPTCRLYPKEDAEACTYTTSEGVKYTGQSGYCLERDPSNPGICLAWWPVDAIRGEVNAFGNERAAGFGGPFPLYYCVQNRLYAQGPQNFISGCINGGGGRCEEKDCARNVQVRLDQDANGDGQPDNGEGTLCPSGYVVQQTTGTRGMRCGGRCDRSLGADRCEYTCEIKGGGPPAVTEYTGNNAQLPNTSIVSRCAVVAKVADLNQNSAWAARVTASSLYKVPNNAASSSDIDAFVTNPPNPPYVSYPVQAAGPIRPVDFPYGRIVQETDAATPSDWSDILSIRATCENVSPSDPLSCAPGVNPTGVAAGVATPYAWARLTTQPSGFGCPQFDFQCQNAAQPNLGNGVCTENPSTCSTNPSDVCTTTNGCRVDGANFRACTFTPVAPATQVLGTCSGTATSCDLNNRRCSHDLSISCTSDAVCAVVPGSLCLNPDAQCNTGVSCAPIGLTGRKQCQGGGGNTAFTSANGEGRCTDLSGSVTASSASCNTDNDCAQSTYYCKEIETSGPFERTEGRCADAAGNTTGTRCTTDAECSVCILPQICETPADCFTSNCTAPTGVLGTCPASTGGGSCSSFNDCYGSSVLVCQATDRCIGGLKNATVCDSNADCRTEYCSVEGSNAGSCQLITPGVVTAEPIAKAISRVRNIFGRQYGIWYWQQSAGRYEKCDDRNLCPSSLAQDPAGPYSTNLTADLSSWSLPTDLCPLTDGLHTRPTAIGSSTTDFCGVPPRIFNEAWAGGQTTISLTRGQQATLTFNTDANLEQKPLKQIFINWTGRTGDESRIQRYDFPYDSKSSPTDPHVFRYAYGNTSFASTTYRPTVLVVDNWGWCNNGVDGDPCVEDPGSWQQLTVSVIVN